MIGHQFIFIHIPRTGGTSFERLLLSLETTTPWESLSTKRLVDQCVGPVKHYKASRIQELVGQKRWQATLKLSIVRNPFDKVISHFFQPYYRDINALSGQSLDSFLRSYAPAPHEEGRTCSDYLDREIDLIIRYENYDSEVSKLLSPYGIQLAQIRERIGAVRETFGADASSNYRTYYSTETKQLVEDLYKDDLERFGYVF
jgi:hypothetical protein